MAITSHSTTGSRRDVAVVAARAPKISTSPRKTTGRSPPTGSAGTPGFGTGEPPAADRDRTEHDGGAPRAKAEAGVRGDEEPAREGRESDAERQSHAQQHRVAPGPAHEHGDEAEARELDGGYGQQ